MKCLQWERTVSRFTIGVIFVTTYCVLVILSFLYVIISCAGQTPSKVCNSSEGAWGCRERGVISATNFQGRLHRSTFTSRDGFRRHSRFYRSESNINKV